MAPHQNGGNPPPVPPIEPYPAFPKHTGPRSWEPKPGQNIRLVYDPERDNKNWMQEHTAILPCTISYSVWNNNVSANAAVRRQEWRKIQASPDPERALKRYNDFNKNWIFQREFRLEMFHLERQFSEYDYMAHTRLLQTPRTFYMLPLLNFRPLTKHHLEPTYFGFSRKVYE
ncbi:hypothetical protein BV898_11795 [Hypsibius exemplaris]|uniref:Uncharacterized protein n=1 Tax=Hypsibius exemplaris TaxID=2072580 RepID=A0A1W0WFP7_HYPEX|nr:hypothetical protein BV898_11795 [Hypsibius exemplaris]